MFFFSSSYDGACSQVHVGKKLAKELNCVSVFNKDNKYDHVRYRIPTMRVNAKVPKSTVLSDAYNRSVTCFQETAK